MIWAGQVLRSKVTFHDGSLSHLLLKLPKEVFVELLAGHPSSPSFLGNSLLTSPLGNSIITSFTKLGRLTVNAFVSHSRSILNQLPGKVIQGEFISVSVRPQIVFSSCPSSRLLLLLPTQFKKKMRSRLKIGWKQSVVEIIGLVGNPNKFGRLLVGLLLSQATLISQCVRFSNAFFSILI